MTTAELDKIIAEIEARTQRCDFCRQASDVLIVRKDQSEVCISCFLQSKGVHDAMPQRENTL